MAWEMEWTGALVSHVQESYGLIKMKYPVILPQPDDENRQFYSLYGSFA